MNEVSDFWRRTREAQKLRRRRRLEGRIKRAMTLKVPWRWLNKPYQMRCEIGIRIIDYYPIHSIVKIMTGKKWKTRRGFESLRDEIAKAKKAAICNRGIDHEH